MVVIVGRGARVMQGDFYRLCQYKRLVFIKCSGCVDVVKTYTLHAVASPCPNCVGVVKSDALYAVIYPLNPLSLWSS